MRKFLTLVFALLAAIQVAFAAVDINTASEAELDGLPGIGPSKAKAIVAERTRHGPFRSVEDLKRVKGIGDKVLDKLKGQVTASGGAVGASKADTKPDQPKSAGGVPPKPAGTVLPVPAGVRSVPAASSAAPVPAGLKTGAESGNAPAPANPGEGRVKAMAADPKPAPRPAGASGGVPAPAGAKGAPTTEGAPAGR